MYGNSNQYWKKTANTTNVEVVIDDPSQIQDTYITNRQIFQDIVVFDITANDFVYQPTSNSIQNAVSGAGGSETNVIMYMFGSGSGDSDMSGGGGVGDQGLQGGGGIGGGLGQIRRGTTGGTVDVSNPFIPELNTPCREKFEKFLEILRELKRYYENESLLDLGFAAKWWWSKPNLGFDLPLIGQNHPLWLYLGCVIESDPNTPRPGLFDTWRDYVRKVFNNEEWVPASAPDVVPLLLPPDSFPKLPNAPGWEGIPLDPLSVERWLEQHPAILENFDRDLKRALEVLRNIPININDDEWVKQNVPKPCREKFKDLIRELQLDLVRIAKIVDILQRLKKAFDDLFDPPTQFGGQVGQPCWDELNLEQEFNRRNIGRFFTVKDFFQWLLKWVEENQGPDVSPFNNPLLEDKTPLSNILSDDQRNRLNDIYDGNIPLTDRIANVSLQYEKWLNESEESRSIFPPIKGLFRSFDNQPGSPVMTERDAYTALLYYAIYLRVSPEGLKYYNSQPNNVSKENVTDFEDFLINIASFVSQPDEFFYPPNWTA